MYRKLQLWLKPALLLGLIMSLSACSFKTTYRFLDWIVPWYVDDYVTLSDMQERLLDDELADLLAWHQSQELTRYAEDIALFRGQVISEQWTAEQWLAQLDRMRSHQRRLLAELIPGLAKLIRSFSDEQVDEVFANLTKQVDEARQESKQRSAEDWQQHWYERNESNLEKWLDNLTESQQQVLYQWSTQRPYDQQLVTQQGDFWNERLRQIFDARNAPSLEADLMALLLAEHTVEGFEPYLKRVRLSYANLYAQMQSTMTDKQKRHIDKALAKWQDDFSDLAERYQAKETNHGSTDAGLAGHQTASR
ncbi:hypothetical protein GCM10011369_31170 [Neiella marina]|uniref:Lipoprotein n=1 Tax=Neiella marina TaxID=508461 RepID=A0A8J2U8S5_9GAMM|nr:DUF6279 family lipoprotein [Neiella marina]GGA86894.1 hypothetical protein GCM10011369_31170 [Neiella marina]